MIDFLIIGGGIAGVSVAARVSRLGSTVLLETEDHLAYHASGRSAAMFEENYGQPSTVALNAASRSFHEATDVLSARGFLLVGSAGNEARFDADMADLKLSEIGVDDARGMIPVLDTSHVTRAAYHADAWDMDTHALLTAFSGEARRNGTQILTGSAAISINRIPTGWEVDTQRNVHFARYIINAAGAWVDEIAEMSGIAPIGFAPLRRSMARLPAPGGLNVANWPMMAGPGESWYAKPDAGALVVSPGDEDPVSGPHDAYADDMVLAEGLMRYEAHVEPPVERLLASWAGLRTFAPDRALVLGPDPTDDKFIWCAGQGGYGMQTAPAASELIADLLSGHVPVIDPACVTALSPARFAKGTC